MTINIIYNHT